MLRYRWCLGLLGIVAGCLWLISAATTVALPCERRPLVFYSNQSRHDLKLTLCEAIRSARSSLYVSVYGVTDLDVIRLINRQAEAGVAVTLCYDASASLALGKYLHPKVSHTAAKGKGLMHQKVIVVDDSQVFVGSANLTEQSLHMHDNFVVGLFHPPLARFLQTAGHSFCAPLGGQEVEAWQLPGGGPQAMDRLLALIGKARKSIYVAMFTLTHPSLVASLVEAAQRGVDVRCAIDFYTARGASLKAMRRLQEANIPVFLSRGKQLLHHKWAWIDKKTLVTGSANWTKAAFQVNRESLLILRPLSRDQRTTLRRLWSTIELDAN